MNNKVTVIIPAFNEESTIQRCVDSLLNQTVVPNIIVVNDGSFDNTLQKISKYKTLDNFLLINQENQGVSVARNRGIKAAKTEFITFLDADDYVENNFIQVLLDGYRQNGSIDLSVCNYSIKQQDSKSIVCGQFKNGVIDPFKYFDLVINNNSVNGFVYNKMFRKSIIEKCNIWFDPQTAIGEDFLFCFLYGGHCREIALSNSVQIHYLPTSSGISDTMQISGHFSAKIFDYFYANLKMLKYLNSLNNNGSLNSIINREIYRTSITATTIIRKVYLYQQRDRYSDDLKQLKSFLKMNLLFNMKNSKIKKSDKLKIFMAVSFPEMLKQFDKWKIKQVK